MLSENLYYQAERRHASEHFIAIVVLMLLAFVLSGQGGKEIAEKSILSGFVLLVSALFCVAHFYFLSRAPGSLVDIRKYLLILLDVGLLTFFADLFGELGIFVLPFYMVVTVRAGYDFGIRFFYASLFLTLLSWGVLYAFSPYWQEHIEILGAFGIVMALLPFLFAKYLKEIHATYSVEPEETPSQEEVRDESRDMLTGIASRKAFKDEIMSLLHAKKPFTMLFLDVNKLQAINEIHGKEVGDEVLKEVVRRVSELLDEDDFFGRLGGDDFVIITPREKIYFEKFLAKLERTVMGRHKTNGIIVPIELNIGISRYPEDAENAMMLSRYADEAMHCAKEDTTRYHCYYEELLGLKG